MWKLRPGWSAEFGTDGLILRSDTRKLLVRSASHLPSDLPHRLTTGSLVADEKTPEGRALQFLLTKLIGHGVLIPLDANAESIISGSPLAEYIAHVGIDPQIGLTRIGKSRILILGLGGTGSIVIQHLVGAGIQHFVLVDDDVVHQSNLNRQFIYAQNDIGTHKTKAARHYILSRASVADVQTFQRRIKNKTDVLEIIAGSGKIDLCVICIDQPIHESFDTTAEFLWETNIPCLYGGVMIRSGFYGPLFDQAKSPHPSSFSLRCASHEDVTVSPLRMVFPPCNTVIATLMTAELLHYVIGAHDVVDFQCRTFFDLSRGQSIKLGPTLARE